MEDMAENRRVFYVGCTRAKNHLILAGTMKKALMQGEGRSLTTEDYRERATILELLDDIYGFNTNFPYGGKRVYRAGVDMPSVIWCEPESRGFKGVKYQGISITAGDFGTIDEERPVQTVRVAIISAIEF
jgi:hypothetical protein